MAGPEGKVFAVEPNPINFKFLKLNVRAFKNVEVIEGACGVVGLNCTSYKKGTLSSSNLGACR